MPVPPSPSPPPDPLPLETRLRVAVEASPSGLLMADEEGRIILVNREIERLFGYSREELLGRPVEMLIPEARRRAHPGHRRDFTRDPRERQMGAGRDLSGLRRDGSEVPVEIGLNPIHHGDRLFVLASVVDISARKQVERERRQLEEELRRAQRLEALGTLAGGVAHDFNNILAGILGFAELARDQVADRPEVRGDLDEIVASAVRGRELVERILRFARQEEERRAPLDPGEIVQDVSRLLRATIPSSIDLRVRVARDVPRIVANVTSVQQVLMNLANNAAHAMGQEGRLDISVDSTYLRDTSAREHADLREGSYVVLTVADSGPGMDPGTRARAFEPFFTTKAPGEGSGLGLALVHRVLRTHDGAVELESEEGSGTRVRCFFPAREEEEDAGARTGRVVAPGSPGALILLVDDEPRLVEAGRRRLEAFGHRVVCSSDAEQALARFRAEPDAFDLVITDLTMPGLTGIQFADAVREQRPELPVLLLSGHAAELDEARVRELGVHAVLVKPVTAAELAREVEGALRTRPPKD